MDIIKLVRLLLIGLLPFFMNAQVDPPYPSAPPAASSIAEAEYFVDVDPGFGNGTPIAASGLDVAINNLNVNTTGLADGAHILFIRAKNAQGHWSLVSSRVFGVESGYPTAPAAASNIVAAEYFVATDPGIGNGTAISLSAGLDVALTNVPIDVTGLIPGVHRLALRTQDANGTWSLTSIRDFEVVFDAPYPAAPDPQPNIVATEYLLKQLLF
jgi:hypothetical protein